MRSVDASPAAGANGWHPDRTAFRAESSGLDPTEPDASAPHAIARAEDPPWPTRVDGAELLSELRAFASRFVVAAPEALTAVALWSLFAWVHDEFETSPILAVVSPTKRCGKTNVLQVLHHLCPRAVLSSNLTGPALFRIVDAERPTLLVDEADSFLIGREDLRGILNSGHTRAAAWVLRAAGPGNRPRRFSTWCPKAVAAIGALPATVEDRSILLRLQRKRTTESADRPHGPGVEWESCVLRRRAARWALDHAPALGLSSPESVPGLHDRSNDCWMPLLAMAEACGGGWPGSARAAALELASRVQEQDLVEILLADLREVFTRRGAIRLPPP